MKTLLCYGDSNTHGICPMAHPTDRRRYDRSTRWPGVTAAALGDDWSVIEEGLPARTTVYDEPAEGPHKNGLLVLPAMLETHRPLDAVALMLGTNDLKARHSLTPIDIALSVERLLITIAANGCGPSGGAPKVLVIAPVPIEERRWLGEMFEGGAAKSRALGAYYRDVADRNGVGFLDAGDFAEVDPVEGIHLSAESHASIGNAVAKAVLTLGA